MLANEEDVINLIQSDQKMMKIIQAASMLDLPDWWICAGFVRTKIWDTLHGFLEPTELPDVDLIYFDTTNTEENVEKEWEKKLSLILPNIPWSVKNEARMHLINNLQPYTSSEDAISKFPETATALGVKLDKENRLVLTAPCGLDDVLHFVLRPTPYFTETKGLHSIYEERIIKKNWKSIWHKINVYHTVRSESNSHYA